MENRNANAARAIINNVSGDSISNESTPVVAAELMEAQVRATLALAEVVAEMCDRIVAAIARNTVAITLNTDGGGGE